MTSNTYQQIHARHYDRIYAEKPYADEARFVARWLPEAGRVLDLACGTARHAVELARLGFQVTGLDYSAHLLEHAAANVQAAGVEIELLEQDMRRPEVPAGTFDGVTCLFDSIGYPQSNEGVLQTLRAARECLRPGGRVVVEYLHAPAMVVGYAPVRVRSWDLGDGGELLRISRTELDHAACVMKVEYDLLELQARGTYERGGETQSNRYFSLGEFALLVESAGLNVHRQVAAYVDDPHVDASTWHVLAIAERPV